MVTFSQHLLDIRILLQQELLFKILQLAYFLEDSILVFDHVEVMNDLPLYLHEVVGGVDELQLHVAHRGTHLGIHCLAEEEQLIFIDRIFALVDELDDILQFLAQSLQFYFLYLIVRLVLIRAVQIPLQVDHVAYRGERYVLERTAHVIMVVISPPLVILFQIILYLLVQLAEMSLYIGYIHLFVHLQHLLEEL